MFADFDAAAVTAYIADLTAGLGEYIPFLLFAAAVSIPLFFARKAVTLISRLNTIDEKFDEYHKFK